MGPIYVYYAGFTATYHAILSNTAATQAIVTQAEAGIPGRYPKRYPD